MLLFLLLLEKFNRLDLAVPWLYYLLLSNRGCSPRSRSEASAVTFCTAQGQRPCSWGVKPGRLSVQHRNSQHKPAVCKQEECPSHHSRRLESLRSGLWQVWDWREPISWLISSLLSPCPHGVEVGKRARWDFFYKGTDSTCKGPTSWLPHLPKPPSPSANVRMRFQHVSLGEIQPVSL